MVENQDTTIIIMLIRSINIFFVVLPIVTIVVIPIVVFRSIVTIFVIVVIVVIVVIGIVATVLESPGCQVDETLVRTRRAQSI